jgi:DNA polymerase elongation subunit (family B)
MRGIMDKLNRVIYGKNEEDCIVNISVKNGNAHIFKEKNHDIIESIVPFKPWVLSNIFSNGCKKLQGNQHYKYIKEYSSQEQFDSVKDNIYKYGLFTIHHPAEAFMIRNGYTYFKGMKAEDVSLLSFDIETNGLDPHKKDSTVYLITNAFRKKIPGTNKHSTYYKTFNVEDYETPQDMIRDWCNWVMEINPSIITGYNIISFDFPYLQGMLAKTNEALVLGRDFSEIEIEEKVREKRKDGSQSYSYKRINIFGREVVDMFFVALDYDIGRKYESYRLKSIVKQEGLEKEGRQHYDAGTIKDNWYIPEEREKIIKYAEEDADDPIKLFDLMIPAKFYLTPHIPKPFQIMTESASGSQLNAFMVRAYLQDDFSVAKADAPEEFEGAISFGNPGVYRDVFKVDVASLYPSIMLHYKISPKSKDYNDVFLMTLEYFTKERLANKKKAKDTGDRYFKDLEQAQKVIINSAYGFMGAKGLNYNYPKGAADTTRYGREIITKSVDWAERKGFRISNCDTDSISFTTGKELTEQDRLDLLKELNSLYPSTIRFEDDGYYRCLLVLKAKNYVMFDGEKMKLKGSSIKDQKKEKALSEMLNLMLKDIIDNDGLNLASIYETYIKEALSPKDIKRWSQKKTITKAILNCCKDSEARKNERDVYDAIKNKLVQEGDKVYVYPAILGKDVEVKEYKNGKIKEKVTVHTGLKTVDDWNNDHSIDKLVKRVVDTTEILSNVVDSAIFIDYTIKKNSFLLEGLNENKK